MNESILIKNFGGIEKSLLNLNRINILIWPQASWKSITAKLIYYFKSFPEMLFESAEDWDFKKDFNSRIKDRFYEFFPPYIWNKKTFLIRYEVGDVFIEISKIWTGKISIQYSDSFGKDLTKYRNLIKKTKEQEQEHFNNFRPVVRIKDRYLKNLTKANKGYWGTSYFIPAWRSFYANLQNNIFTFLSSNKDLDPFLIKFWSFYENIKDLEERRNERGYKSDPKVKKIFEELLCWKYLREKDKDFLLHKDKRKINLSFASSWQQETLPLALILKTLESVRFWTGVPTVFIEEPEAHLFPHAQKNIIDLISLVYNISRNRIQFVITTHSPYILSSLNTLMYAWVLRNNSPEIDFNNVIDESMIIDNEKVNAFSINNWKIESIIDKETWIIQKSILDGVSSEISEEFDKLLDL